ncbi:MAG: beta-lactamase family protein [Pseudomonadales bacterium]|nr:beta-lactamase family protein [Pseudomonadales bacterium]
MSINGFCDPAFDAVKQKFADNFSKNVEKGAALAVWFRGELVINLWGGYRDKAQTIPWTQDSIVNVFSTTKMMTALCVQRAVDAGDLDIHRPVKDYWPAYHCEGKGQTTLAWMLNHRSALPAIKQPVADEALFDWEYMCNVLAKHPPWWQPGNTHGYHMVTYGWLVGEAFRRLMGVSIGEYLRTEIAQPHGLNIHIGLDESKHKIADLFAASEAPQAGRIHLFKTVLADREGITAKALTNPATLMTSSNTSAWRRMELPSANAHCDAASLATLMGLCVAGDKVISEAAVQRLMTEESAGYDPVLTTPTRFGPGVMLQQLGDPEAGFGPMQSAFGHPGSGGSLAFADPDNQIGFAYVMNQMGPYLMVDPRPRALVDTFYAQALKL